MSPKRSDIISQLKREILSLGGLKCSAIGTDEDFRLGPIQAAFPNGCFPVGAVHEFLSEAVEDKAATTGFISCLLSALMRNGGASLWISCSRNIFPPALKAFDIEPDKIIFIDLLKEKEVLWTMEEALKCDGLAAVVGEIRDISFTSSRRLQLAVEQSHVTGFILRHPSHTLNTIASVSRWKITPLPSELEEDLPGVGFPRWNVELMKIRNGKPGSWKIQWAAGRFQHISPLVTVIAEEQNRKTG
jgi:protein ImuA